MSSKVDTTPVIKLVEAAKDAIGTSEHAVVYAQAALNVAKALEIVASLKNNGTAD